MKKISNFIRKSFSHQEQFQIEGEKVSFILFFFMIIKNANKYQNYLFKLLKYIYNNNKYIPSLKNLQFSVDFFEDSY